MDQFGEDTVVISRVAQVDQKQMREQVRQGEREQRPPAPANFAKLSYQRLFYQSHNRIVDNKKVEGNHIAVMRLATDDQHFSLQSFYSSKEIHEKGIRKFKALYHSEQGDPVKRRRRGYSIDSEATGAYYLNNWLSHEDFFCEKPPPQQRTASLIYDLLTLRWGKALETVAALPRSPHTAPLQYILNGFRSVSNLLAEDEKQLADHFLNRNTHEIIALKLSSESVGGGYAIFVNAFEEDAKIKFHQIRSIPRKVEILKVNLQYLIKFAGTYRPKVQDGYLQLAFRLLSNSIDQEGGAVTPQQDYMRLLLRLDLRLSDRLNFATKLLGERRRRQFCSELEERLSVFPRLENILYYTSPPLSKSKQERIQLICRAYLDENLDLQTVAGLANEFPFLRKYYLQFKQALQLSGENGELDRFENYKWTNDKEVLKEEERRPKKALSFFECINVAQERVGDWKTGSQTASVCQICCKKMLKGDILVQCGKCRHGGHVNHLVKWFQQYENCPHIGCPCLCN